MRFIIVAVGTRGDVFPLITLAGALTKRRHAVALLAPSGYRDMASDAGVSDFRPYDKQKCCSVAGDQLYLLPTRYSPLFFRRYACLWNAVIYDLLRAEAPARPLVLSSASGLLWADLIAHKNLGLPVIRVQVDPPDAGFQSPLVPVLPESAIQPRLVWECALQWRKLAAERGLNAGITTFQRTQARKNSLPHVGLFPEWLISGAQRIRRFELLAGFLPSPLRPVPVESAQPVAKDQLVFVGGTEGTLDAWMDRFAKVSLEACNETGLRGLLLGSKVVSRSNGHSPLRWLPFQPLTEPLRTALMIVHHGGIGTAAEAIRAGVPQIVVPRVFSQFSNAAWLVRAGVADVIGPDEFSSAMLSGTIRKIANSVETKARVQRVAGLSDPDANLARLCVALEAFQPGHNTSPWSSPVNRLRTPAAAPYTVFVEPPSASISEPCR